ncbi:MULTISPECIES: transcriptional regulator [unclassified Pseudoclavibacter]|uniref:transcriptional regulator n=1 Tax=unclassified Pseudoclavibacter TaxID=2615177 RepID=UPI00188D9366|nr:MULTISPECIES: transcriptional regulator [unclassified Pseudoclavibacter]MBF4548692.1 transcriptional regulator [Pseudoclavibacter sp. VKM Ac-2888]
MSETPELRALFSPPRFKVLGFLVQVEESDYASIGEFTGLGVPEISRTVKFLDEAGLVQVRKGQKGRYPQTLVRATPSGRERFRELLADLQRYGLGG